MPVPFKKFKKALQHYNAWEEPSRGKGGHTAFLRDVGGGRIELFPLPKKKEVLDSYVKAARRKLRLMPSDGVSDEDFAAQLK